MKNGIHDFDKNCTAGLLNIIVENCYKDREILIITYLNSISLSLFLSDTIRMPLFYFLTLFAFESSTQTSLYIKTTSEKKWAWKAEVAVRD